MAKVILYIATSMDGYIARPDGNIDWLTSTPPPSEGDYGYANLLSRIGSTIMGRKTYEEILSFGIEWPYKGMTSYVVSNQPDLKIESPDTFMAPASLSGLVRELKENHKKDIWLIGGGQLVRSFLEEKLIDEMIISVIPKTIGNGLPLFPESGSEADWRLFDVKAFETGVVNLMYYRIEQDA